MKELTLMEYLYSKELGLSRKTIKEINKLAVDFNLENIFTTRDSKEDVLEKIEEIKSYHK